MQHRRLRVSIGSVGDFRNMGIAVRHLSFRHRNACVQLFFLPPIGTFTIADPQNWIALFTFLLTAVIASQLSERARRETANATSRRRELEQLYAFSQQMLTADNVLGLVNAIPVKVVEIFGAEFAGMFSIHSKKVYYSDLHAVNSSLRRICSG